MEDEMIDKKTVSRRDMLAGTMGVAAGATLLNSGLIREAFAGRSLTLADIGVGDPGDWSKLKATSGNDVNVVSIGNAPSAVVNQLLAGGGLKTFDIINIVGGMQKPMIENNLILPLDTSRLKNWNKNTYIKDYLSKGTPGFNFIGHGDKLYGVPTVLQGDSFAYLPDKTGDLDSYSALFDPKHRGYVSLEDNYTTAAQKTALFLKASGQVKIGNPGNMSPEEIKAVVDFLIAQKKAGQFRVIWSSFEQAVNLLVNKEVHVMDCWEPMVFVAKGKGHNVKYADPKEGFLLWAMAAYIVAKPGMTEAQLEDVYELLDFMLGPWYGAKITLLRGYMTNPQAVEYAKSHPSEFSADEAKKVGDITAGVAAKFAKGGTWQNRWPTHVDVYEEEWQRFKSA